MNTSIRWRSLAALAGTIVATHAQAAFDFETLPEGQTNSFSVTDNGITATFFAAPGQLMEVYDLTGAGRPPHWGTRSVWTGDVTQTTTVNFSQPLLYVSLEFGDYFADDDRIYLNAFAGLNGSGAAVDTATVSWPGNRGLSTPDYVTLFVTGTEANPIRSLQLGSVGFEGRNNIFFDNMSVEPASVGAVPEPFTMGLIAAGLGAAALRRRKR